MKKVIAIIVAFVCMLPGFAESVSQKQASHYAQLFFNQATGRVTAPPRLVFNGRKLTTGRLFTPFYVYNNLTGGFVIVSAENKAFPILGFSLSRTFDPNSLSEGELALLRSYAREIELIRYDSSPVSEAENAWVNFADYLTSVLESPYVATDPLYTPAEADRLVENAELKEDAVYSDIYTPSQWTDMVLDDLSATHSVPLVLVEGNKDFPAVVYGHQGNFFRIDFGERNDWRMLLNATENISANMISAVVRPIPMEESIEEDSSFADFDEFLTEVMQAEETRSAVSSIDKIDFETSPLLRSVGGGHFEITLPEEALRATVYNLNGSMVELQTYNGSNVVNIDLSPEPRGFYFVTVIGESGTPYGMKLYR